MLNSKTGVPACTLLWSGTTVIGREWEFRLYDVFWRIYLNRDPGAVIRHPGGTFAIPAGVPVILPPYGEFDAICSSPVRHAWLHFDCPIPEPDVVRVLVPAPVALRQREEWDTLFNALPITARTSAEVQLMCQSLICIAVVEACSRGRSGPSAHAIPAVTRARRRVEPALRRIDADLAKPLDGQALAVLCGLTRSYFVRVFSLATGQTPARYLIERRIHLIAGQLAVSDLTIERLAADYGFADRYHFTRVFTRVMTVSPAAYRKASRG